MSWRVSLVNVNVVKGLFVLKVIPSPESSWFCSYITISRYHALYGLRSHHMDRFVDVHCGFTYGPKYFDKFCQGMGLNIDDFPKFKGSMVYGWDYGHAGDEDIKASVAIRGVEDAYRQTRSLRTWVRAYWFRIKFAICNAMGGTIE